MTNPPVPTTGQSGQKNPSSSSACGMTQLDQGTTPPIETTPSTNISEVRMTNSESNQPPRNSPVDNFEEAHNLPPSDSITSALKAILEKVEHLAKQTDARFEALTPKPPGSNTEPRENAQRSANTLNTPDQFLQQIHMNLFGDPPPTSHQQLTPRPQTPVHALRTSPFMNLPGDSYDVQEKEIEAMKQKLQDMTSKIHQATSSAPEINRVYRQAQSNPFTPRLKYFPLSNPGKFKIPTYDGTSDPGQHLTTFTIAMGRARFRPEERDAGLCKLFAENLEGNALEWFTSLEANSIDNFEQLATSFLKHYSMFIQHKSSISDLWALKQDPNEPLRKFVERFKKIASRVVTSNDDTIHALINALWYDSKYRLDLKINKPLALEDALHRATLFIEIEEERSTLANKHATTIAYI